MPILEVQKLRKSYTEYMRINAGEIGIAFAVAVIYMIPGLLMFLHGEAYLVEGIAHSGSVKG